MADETRPSKNRLPLQQHLTVARQNSDRFIAHRGSMDFDVARYLLTEKEKENNAGDIPSKETYKKEFAASLLKDSNFDWKKSRVLTFKEKKPLFLVRVSKASFQNVLPLVLCLNPAKFNVTYPKLFMLGLPWFTQGSASACGSTPYKLAFGGWSSSLNLGVGFGLLIHLEC